MPPVPVEELIPGQMYFYVNIATGIRGQNPREFYGLTEQQEPVFRIGILWARTVMDRNTYIFYDGTAPDLPPLQGPPMPPPPPPPPPAAGTGMAAAAAGGRRRRRRSHKRKSRLRRSRRKN